jgi:ABC-type polysaccharide/polyol phosphate transport system ATPase subunit
MTKPHVTSQPLQDSANRAAILVLASHNPLFIDRYCNRVLRLEHGRIAEDARKDSAPEVPVAVQEMEVRP